MTSKATAEVYRIDWLPGTDILHGTCHCGAEHTDQDPTAMWEWMLSHPTGHSVASADAGQAAGTDGKDVSTP
ncbi:hypothetical protein [Streptomyces sp. TP-A0874]|uniref:hypothetical protein n=1 Tax=Streptomyces sp. TP-A0874 TaxID=549819 RepID=UPI000852FE28|nr:hypothetical protein [Streptomyces sp. TP-A0874]